MGLMCELLESRRLLSASGLHAAPMLGQPAAVRAPLAVHATHRPIARFSWGMPARYGLDSNGNGQIDLPNSADYVNPAGYTLNLDASASTSPAGIASYQWTLSSKLLATPQSASGETASFINLPQGQYTALLTVTDAAGATSTSHQLVDVRDLLIVTLGDSYASGEGNPVVPISDGNPAQWADGVSTGMTTENAEAHRSTAAATSLAALKLENASPHFSVTYVNLAQSGATIAAGMLGSETGTDGSYTLPAQLQELASIVGTRKIDLLNLSIGGNDFGFATFVSELLENDLSDNLYPGLSTIQQQVGPALRALPAQFTQLAGALSDFSIGKTLITAYPDMTRNTKGQFNDFASDILPGASISAKISAFADRDLLIPLDNTLAAIARAHHWQYAAGYLPAFEHHGYAAAQPWFMTATAALATQGADSSVQFGDVTIPISDGTLHPNAAGQNEIGTVLEAGYLLDLAGQFKSQQLQR